MCTDQPVFSRWSPLLTSYRSHVEVLLTKFEKSTQHDGTVEDSEVLSRQVDENLEYYHFKWNVAYGLSMPPHKIRLWKRLLVCIFSHQLPMSEEHSCSSFCVLDNSSFVLKGSLSYLLVLIIH